MKEEFFNLIKNFARNCWISWNREFLWGRWEYSLFLRPFPDSSVYIEKEILDQACGAKLYPDGALELIFCAEDEEGGENDDES
jgi:hypothetical protein